QSQDFGEPADHLTLDMYGGVIAAGDTRIHHRRQLVGKDAHHRWWRIHPAPESRVPVAEWVRLNRTDELVEDRVGFGSIRGRRIARGARRLVDGNWRKHGPGLQPFEIVRYHVRDTVRNATHVSGVPL